MAREHAAELVGFPVRKNVRKSVGREADRARRRRMWETSGMLAMLVAIVLVVVWQHIRLRDYGYENAALAQELAAEQAANRQLLLQIETLQSPGRIEDLAVRKLHMIAPSGDDAVVIERVTRPAAPPKTAVAARRED